VGPLRILVVVLSLTLVGTAAAGPLQFVAVNDTPYDSEEEKRFTTKIPEAIAAAGVPFVVVPGDIKSGKEACTDELLTKRRAQLDALHPDGAVFYTPGDNDWTDCDRDRFGKQARSELGALDFLRATFFVDPPARKNDPAWARQEGYPENVRWSEAGVVFVTLHVVGTNNGRVQILEDDVDTVLDRVDAREAAAHAWLDEAATHAASAEALVVVQHGDPTRPAALGNCVGEHRQNCDPYGPERDRLAAIATTLGKPVLLIHGDTNPFCIEQGFEDAPTLWRLNAWGDFQEPGDATLVTVDPTSEVPFSARTLLEGKAAEACP